MKEPLTTTIEVALDAQATIGESPTWHPPERVLYWLDIKAPTLNRFDPATGRNRSWLLAAETGAFALLADGSGAVLAQRTGIARLEFATGAEHRLAPPPFDQTLFRFNEGTCDRQGRFWVGVMFDPLDPSAKETRLPAQLHSFTLGTGLRPEPDAAELHNGMAWSEDGATFFLSHSNTSQIHRFDIDEGRLGRRHAFASTADLPGLPDGGVLDRQGGYWASMHGAGRLRRFHADGSHDRDVILPVSQPTGCAFAGPELDCLYVTTARDKLERPGPLDGALLRLRPGETGVARRSTII